MARAHATVAGLARRERLQRLAEVSSPDRSVTAALLQAAIDGDLSSYTDAERSSAGKALDFLQRRVDDANGEVDGYLARYPDLAAGGSVAVHALDIAAWRVLGGGSDSERYARYKAAVRFLEGVAAGRIDLLEAERQQAAESADVLFSTPDPTFTDDSLKTFVDPSAEAGAF